MSRRREWRRRVDPLPLQVVYTVAELAKACGLPRRRLERLFARVGVRLMRVGSQILVPLSELEEKAWPFWESIQAAESLRQRKDE